MLNYWWVTRPKRKLNSIPEVLACCADVSLNSEWQGNIYTHLAFEESLEKFGLKRIGERRDRRGGGGRTYFAWLFSLGLIFMQESTNQVKLTLAGEAILNGVSPVKILRDQILKYQFPSAFSLSPSTSKTRVNLRFKIRPFRFLLRLLRDSRLGFVLSQEEIARVVVIEAENESDTIYNHVVNRILDYRENGEKSLPKDFFDKYSPSSGRINLLHPYSHLDDLANTIINWLDYTQLIIREVEGVKKSIVKILPERIAEVDSIINDGSKMIPRPQDQEYFQRRYGLDYLHKKDTRNFNHLRSITTKMLNEQKIKQIFLSEALKTPISKINHNIISIVAEKAGLSYGIVEENLLRIYPHGAIGTFMAEYFNMAFNGRDESKDFEKATVEIFKNAFGFHAEHVGSLGLTPDIILMSNEEGYQAIIDNKAYANYSISNDHFNRMVHNYIGNLNRYSSYDVPLAFFAYIAGGFCNNIDSQINRIYSATNVNGSAISVVILIKMLENNQNNFYTHSQIKNIFSLNRQIKLSDLFMNNF